MKTTHPNQSRNMIAVAITITIFLTVVFKTCGQCITDTAAFPWDTFNECWSAPLNATDEYNVTCPSWYNGGGFVYEFQSDGINPVSIIVDGQLNYTFDPEGSIWTHAFITDGCNGPTIWSTSNGCALPPYVTVLLDSSPAENWSLDILLPQGVYYLHIGNGGVSQVQYDIEGCLHVLIGTAGALNLGVRRYYIEGATVTPWAWDLLGRRCNQ